MNPRLFHFDADAFFAAVEQASDPRLRGKAVAVGGEKRGIIASASYEARKFGIYTPMPTARARRLCPHLILIPGDYEKYERFSSWMFSYFYDFTPYVEATSIDEGYADFSGSRKPALEIAQTVQRAIRESLKISVSEGLGANKLISQVASKLRKPGGLVEVPDGEERGFLAPLPNKWLPGVGEKTGARLNAAGLPLIHQIAATPADLLFPLVGSYAPQLREFALGIDPRPLVLEKPAAKSVGQQHTYEEDVTDENLVEARLRRMADELCAELRADGQMTRTLTVKVRYNDFAEDQHAESLAEPTDLETDLYGRLRPLLRTAWRRRVSLRLVSLRLSNLYPTLHRPELALFPTATNRAAQRRLADAVDGLREKRGRSSVVRGHDLLLDKAEEGGKKEEGNRKMEDGGRKAEDGSRKLEDGRRAEDGSRKMGDGRRKEEDENRRMENGGGARPSHAPSSSPSSPSHSPSFSSHLPSSNSHLPSSISHLPPIPQWEPSGDPVFRARAVAMLRPETPARPTSPTGPTRRTAPQSRATWTPLHVHSHFSFLDSTLSPKRIAELAAGQGCPAVALTDPGLHGAVPFHQSLKAVGVKPIVGAELRVDGKTLLVYAENATGYARLCRWLTARGRPAEQTRRRVKPEWPDTTGLVAVASDPALAPHFAKGAFYLGAASDKAAERWAKLRPDLPVVAVPRIHYADPSERRMYDILQGMRTLTLLDAPHPDKRRAGDFSFRAPAGAARLFADHPRALDLATEIADRCSFDFDYSRLHFPSWRPPDGTAPGVFLEQLAEAGLRARYGARAPSLRAQVQEELRLIREVGYEEYFLAVWDLLQDCRRKGIEWITRGSAADSLVCYCLGISDVCPVRFDLYFRRFLNRERMRLNKLPDIDLDFPHDRKNDVVDLVFAKFGAERTAIVGGFSTFQSRSAFAEIAKVLGVSEHQVRRVTEKIPRVRAREIQAYTRSSLEFADLPLGEEPFKTAFEMADRLDGVPRHAKQHPCGVVISHGPMTDLMPCFHSHSGYPTTHGDMDAVEAIGLVKIDILAQGGLAVMRDALQAVRRQTGPTSLTSPTSLSPLPPEFLALEPWEDPAVWSLIATGQGRGVHHIESPAMIGLAQSLNCRDIDTLIAMVSVIRPGAANEQKKQRFARRHQGMEPVDLPHPSLEGCLRGTYGLVIYEEQILQICEAFAGLDPGLADILRRSLVKRDLERAAVIGRDFLACARARGRSDEEIRTVWELVCGFNGYAFCKAHSTAYGVEAYHAAWLKCHHPAEFMAAVLQNGKGFYDALVYVLESLRLGIGLKGPCVNGPARFQAIPPAAAGERPRITVPLSRINGLTARTLLVAERAKPFTGVRDFIERAQPDRDEAEALLRAGAFDAFSPARTALFWEVQAALRGVERGARNAERGTKNSELGARGAERGTTGEERGTKNSELGARSAERETSMAIAEFPAPSSDLRTPISDLQTPNAELHVPTSLFPAEPTQLPPVALTEPSPRQRLQDEMDLLGFAVSGHPLDLYDTIDWDSYCPVQNLLFHLGRVVTCCGLVVEGRTAHQVTGETMKFMTIADRTGLVETELFAEGYKRHGLATVRFPVLEVVAVVEPHENKRGYSLRILRAGAPREVKEAKHSPSTIGDAIKTP